MSRSYSFSPPSASMACSGTALLYFALSPHTIHDRLYVILRFHMTDHVFSRLKERYGHNGNLKYLLGKLTVAQMDKVFPVTQPTGSLP
jgi:hypothetical protein